MDRDTDVRKLARSSRRAVRFAADAACARCGERDTRVLIEGARPPTCYQCKAEYEGRPKTEAHHVAGCRNLPLTATVAANDHRILSDLQGDWPAETLRNPGRSPLIAAAAALRGWLDVLRLLIDRAVGWIPGCLEALDRALTEQFGERWWELPHFAACWGEGHHG
jgi:hypothetical protein